MRTILLASALVFATFAFPEAAMAGQQNLACQGRWKPNVTPMGNPLPPTFLVSLTNPLKIWVPATRNRKAGFQNSRIVVPAGAQVAVRYRTGSNSPQTPVFATASLTLAESILPGRRREMPSPARWNGECTAVATW